MINEFGLERAEEACDDGVAAADDAGCSNPNVEFGRLRRQKIKTMQQDGLHVALDDMGMVESLHLAVFHWVLNDVFARINHEGRHAAGK